MACGGDGRLGRSGLPGIGASEENRATRLGEKLDHDPCALLGRLPRPVHGFGQSLAQGTVVVDPRVAEIGEREAPEPADGIIGWAHTRGHVVEKLSKRGLVHQAHYPASV